MITRNPAWTPSRWGQGTGSLPAGQRAGGGTAGQMLTGTPAWAPGAGPGWAAGGAGGWAGWAEGPVMDGGAPAGRREKR